MGVPAGIPSGRCKACGHPERVPAELLLAGGASINAVSRKYGLTRHALGRHWAAHVSDERKATLVLGPVQKAALAARVAEESESVLDHFKSVRAGLWSLYDAAVTAGDGGVGSLIAGRLHENLNSIARITGQLVSSPLVQFNSQVNLKSSPRFLEFEQGMLQLARKHPAMAPDIVALLRGLDREPASPAALPALEHHAAAA